METRIGTYTGIEPLLPLPDEPGRKIANRYEIVRLIGWGGMGAVYLAKDLLLAGDLVAVKILYHGIHLNAEMRERFLLEIQLTRKVSHPNVVRTYDIGSDGELLYLTMEYVKGKALDELFSSEQISLDDAIRVMCQVIDALGAVHAANIIHRDLKPGNILVLSDYTAKITDFGVAHSDSSKLTKNQQILGTFEHLAPELWSGQVPDARTDFYGLGVILYELFTGISPFASNNMATVLWKHMNYTPPAPSEISPGLPDWISELTMNLLDKDPAKRPQKVAEIQSFIEKALPKPSPKQLTAANPKPQLSSPIVNKAKIASSLQKATASSSPTQSSLIKQVANNAESPTVNQNLTEKTVSRTAPTQDNNQKKSNTASFTVSKVGNLRKEGSSSKKRTVTEAPPDSAILLEARLKAGARDFAVDEVANLVLQDPILTIDFLKAANSVSYAGSATLYSVERTLVRLGAQQVIKMLSAMNERPHFEQDEVVNAFEAARVNARRISIAAMIVADAVRTELAEVARTAGLMSYVGHMLACVRHPEAYSKLAASTSESRLVYELDKKQHFNIRTEMLKYLRSQGIPDSVLFPYDEALEAKHRNDSDLRLIVRGAIEIIEAYDKGRWDNYKLLDTLPARSWLRLLKITPTRLKQLHETMSSYLQMIAEQAKSANLIISRDSEEEDAEMPQWSIKLSGRGKTMSIPAHSLHAVSAQGQRAIQALTEICSHAQNIDQLTRDVLDVVAEENSKSFQRGAFIQVIPKEGIAVVQRGKGDSVTPGTIIPIDEPGSAFSVWSTQIRSANTENLYSPFGSGAYAVGAIGNCDTAPVLFYLDPGKKKGLTLESRRIFRLALNVIRSHCSAAEIAELKSDTKTNN